MQPVTPLVEEIRIEASLEEVFALYQDDAHPFWLDSSLPGGKMGHWSFMGSSPFLMLKTYDSNIELMAEGKVRKFSGDPFDVLKLHLSQYKLETSQMPIPFPGGAVGFFSYDLGRMIEIMPRATADDLQVPDIYLGFYSTILAINHLENRSYLVSSGFPMRGEAGLHRAQADLAQAKERLSGAKKVLVDPWGEADVAASEIVAHFSRASYCQAIAKVKDYIAAGDIYQANMTQRLRAPLRMAPFQLYRRLRKVNPAPFAAYLGCGEGLNILCSSPERFLQLNGNVVEARPIKGTMPRGKTPEEDVANRTALLASEKDRAELVMIVDLSRNDLGRVCSYGTVRVPELIALEEYATVFHLVSTVQGVLAPGNGAVELLKAAFPGGSITGAPKVRAMEIIEEMEPVRRGVYTGAIGYLGFDGRMDLNIVIRTFVNKDAYLYLQVGGGIVADSEPLSEYEETLHKAKALLRSLGITSFPLSSVP